MVRCANIANASVFCDKSLTTVDHLASVSRCYPKASYIFLYRYPLDLIASGIEASRWGFNAFGFAPYVGAYAWQFCRRSGQLLDRQGNQDGGVRTDLLGSPRPDLLRAALRRSGRHLGAAPGLPRSRSRLRDQSGGVQHRARSRARGTTRSTTPGRSTPSSIGRGSTLPETFLPGQAQRIDELLAELDYPTPAGRLAGRDLSSLLGLKGVIDSRSNDRQHETGFSRSLVETLTPKASRPPDGRQVAYFDKPVRGCPPRRWWRRHRQ